MWWKKKKKRQRLLKHNALVDLYNCCLLPFLWFSFQSVKTRVFQAGPPDRCTHSHRGRAAEAVNCGKFKLKAKLYLYFHRGASNMDGFHETCKSYYHIELNSSWEFLRVNCFCRLIVTMNYYYLGCLLKKKRGTTEMCEPTWGNKPTCIRLIFSCCQFLSGSTWLAGVTWFDWLNDQIWVGLNTISSKTRLLKLIWRRSRIMWLQEESRCRVAEKFFHPHVFWGEMTVCLIESEPKS